MDKNARFSAIRAYLKLSATAFGGPLGIKKGQVSNIENRKSQPSESVERLLIVHYNIDPSWWETGKGEMFSRKKGPTDPTDNDLLPEDRELISALKHDRVAYLAAQEIVRMGREEQKREALTEVLRIGSAKDKI
jgi:transcriptional regulator with XRE-family HTH domain